MATNAKLALTPPSRGEKCKICIFFGVNSISDAGISGQDCPPWPDNPLHYRQLRPRRQAAPGGWISTISSSDLPVVANSCHPPHESLPFFRNMKIRALIVDAELPARERLGTLLAAHPQLEIVGEAGDVPTAAALCARLEPDVIFLDVQLPGASGFELLPLLSGDPAIIFVTAHPHHAVRAFEVNSLDYLLKPIQPDRLALSVQRLRAHTAAADLFMVEADFVTLKEDGMLRKVPFTAITHIVADDNYSSVHLLDDVPAFLRRSLAEWEKLLPPDKFVRVARSLIVRVAAIQSMRTDSRDHTELLIPGLKLPILLGRRAALHLRRAMENRPQLAPNPLASTSPQIQPASTHSG